MENHKAAAAAALIATLSNSIQALGRGFDVTADTRLLYCKGAPGSRLVDLDEGRARDFAVSEAGVVLKDVPADVEISRERRVRETTPVCSFHEVRLKLVWVSCLIWGNFCFVIKYHDFLGFIVLFAI